LAEHVASIFSAEKYTKQETSIMKAGGKKNLAETFADFQQTTWRLILEDRTLHTHCCENLKSTKSCYISR
jgi:hypothetical protein